MKEDAIIKALDHTIPYEEISTYGTKAGESNVIDDLDIPVDNPPTGYAADV